jgi:hypothetical protein
MNFGNNDADWLVSGEAREARIREIDFRVEERTQSGLAFGAVIGYMDLRLSEGSDSGTQKFDGQYLGIYLRQDYAINDSLSLHGGLGLSYHSGRESGDAETKADIDWTESEFELALGFRFANLRIMPFARLTHIDGDISNGGTQIFELEQSDSAGVRFDIFVEQSAFVRIELVSGAYEGGHVVFVRRY